jgi:hypothetical protein
MNPAGILHVAILYKDGSLRGGYMAKAKVGPIKPSEVGNWQKKVVIPSVVFEVFNTLIATNISGKYARFVQEDVVKMLVEKGYDRKEIFKNGWLNIETAYRDAGWKVTYDSPGYNESYKASFTFEF